MPPRMSRERQTPRDAESSSLPALTRSDAWLLAAIADGSIRRKPIPLASLVEHADWLNRAIPTFDEVSFGLPRLMAHGLVTIENGGYRATTKAVALRRSVKARTLGGVLLGMAAAVGARPYPEPESEDRALRRLPGLKPDDLDEAVRSHHRSIDRWGRVLKGTIRAADLVARPLLAAKRRLRSLPGRGRH